MTFKSHFRQKTKVGGCEIAKKTKRAVVNANSRFRWQQQEVRSFNPEKDGRKSQLLAIEKPDTD
jgi:hypothetical protein